jgi:hypothetical protein
MTTGSAIALDPEETRELLETIPFVSSMPARDNLMVKLSFRAGQRRCEIAQTRIDALLGPRGEISDHIRIAPRMTKGSKGRVIRMHPEIRDAVIEFMNVYPDAEWIAIAPHTGRQMTAAAVGTALERLYRDAGFGGCTSHTGRATCLTELARYANLHGGSLRDVQLFAGHKRLETIMSYLGASEAQSDMVLALGSRSNREGRLNHGYGPKFRARASGRIDEARGDEHEDWAARICNSGQSHSDRDEREQGAVRRYPDRGAKRVPRQPRPVRRDR